MNQTSSPSYRVACSISPEKNRSPISEAVKLQIDLATENAIAAERDSEKIAVEIKSFVGDSDISAFHTALGQYLNYCQALEEQEPDRFVYLVIPLETYQDFFQLPFIQRALRRNSSQADNLRS